MELNPQVIQKKGKREFVVLPYMRNLGGCGFVLPRVVTMCLSR